MKKRGKKKSKPEREVEIEKSLMQGSSCYQHEHDPREGRKGELCSMRLAEKESMD